MIDHPKHKISKIEFEILYTKLNPQLIINKKYLKKKARKAFNDTNLDNKLKYLTFDIFLVFCIIHRSIPEYVDKNMKSFLNLMSGNCEYITPEQATNYSKIAFIYRNYYDNDSHNEKWSPAGLAQMFYYFCYDKSDDEKNNSLRGHIKIDEFIHQNFKKEHWIK